MLECDGNIVSRNNIGMSNCIETVGLIRSVINVKCFNTINNINYNLSEQGINYFVLYTRSQQLRRHQLLLCFQFVNCYLINV